MGVIAAGIAFIMSVYLYPQLAGFLLMIVGKSSWIVKKVYGKNYIGGTWVGILTTKNRKVLAIEQYRQRLSHLIIRGESYRLDIESHKVIEDATWESKSAIVYSENLHVIYQTRKYGEDVTVFELTEGFGSLTISGNEIKGRIIDIPEKVKGGSAEIFFESKTIGYKLKKVKGDKVLSFADAQKTEEWKESKSELEKENVNWKKVD